MRSLLWKSLLALPVVVLLVVLAQRDPGYLLLSYDGFSIETSLWFALLVLLALLWLLLLGRRLLRGGRQLWTQWRGRGERKQAQLVDKGLIAFAEGNWRLAHRRLARVTAPQRNLLPLQLLASLAADRAGELQASRTLLESIRQQNEPDGKLAAGLVEARICLERGEHQSALTLLEALRIEQPDHPSLLRLLAETLPQCTAWPALAELLPQLKKRHLFDEDELLKLEQALHCGLFSSAAASQGAAALEKQFAQLPRPLARNPQIIAAYIDGLVMAGAEPRAEQALREALGRQWDQALVERYGRVKGEQPEKQLALAERWLKQHPQDAVLLRTVARLALRNRLWGRAHQALLASFELQPDPQTAAELARLEVAMGEITPGIGRYRQALSLLIPALPELPLPGATTAQSVRLTSQVDPRHA